MAFRFYRVSSGYRSFRGGSAGRTTLQRKCGCGTHADGGECEACAAKKRAMQRKSHGRQQDEVPSIVYDVLRGPGQPLDTTARLFMESRFERDFSQVRVHTGTQAESSARAVSAQAYTVGNDIVFDRGLYAPGSEQGKRLLAHELAHVAQQGGSSQAPGGRIAMEDSLTSEAAADHAADAAVTGASAREGAAAGMSLQRQQARAAAPTQATAPARTPAPAAATPAAVGPCLEDVVGEEVPTLLQAGAVTIIEFGAPWCNGCEQNKSGLREICANLRRQPPSVPVRMYSIDTDNEANAAVARDYVDNSIPHLYIYVGSTQKVHFNQGLEFDALNAVVAEQIEYASTPGWWRGAKRGALWGMIPGAAAGIAGAIAVGKGAFGLSGNAQMGGVLGMLAGGVAAGALLGGAVGAIAGAVGDDRNKGPRQQQRRRLQPKRRDGQSADPQEREADDWAAHVQGAPAPAPRRGGTAMPVPRHVTDAGEPLDPATRSTMEAHFDRDFSGVRVHRDTRAQRLAGSMDAYAVTSGSDIYFASDAYAPHTRSGQGILGHELAHVAQNASSAPTAATASLEQEAASASASVAQGQRAQIRQGSRQPLLAMTRGEHTAAGAGIGAATLGVVGAAVGLAVAAGMHNQPFGMGALIGGAIGVGLGALAGALIGFFTRRTSPESVPEAEMLIRRRYGRYLPGGVPEPLVAARVHAVSDTELCERRQCRSPNADCSNMIGWTDTGPPAQPATGRMPAPVAAEPSCHGRTLEHATPQQPVIYYVRNSKTAGTLLHEAIHAHAHPAFGFLHNYLNEGVTEYFTRKLQDEINMPYIDGYDDNVVAARRLAADVGEDVLARAYFTGEVPALHRAFNARHGRCALITWAFALQSGSERLAESVIDGGPENNYCQQSSLPFSAAELTPGEEGYQPPTSPEPPAGEPTP